MTKRKPLGDGLSLEERTFVNQANPAPSPKSPDRSPAKEPREYEGFLMLTALRQQMTKFSAERKLGRQHPWTKQDIYNLAIREFLERNGG